MKKVTAAILFKDEHVLIAKRKTGDSLAHKWEFPGGKVEEGETPRECLKREMKEEFHITVKIGEYLGDSLYHDKYGSIRLMAFRTYWESGELVLTVHDDVQWILPNHLKKFDFAPADIPFVQKLVNMDWLPSGKTDQSLC